MGEVNLTLFDGRIEAVCIENAELSVKQITTGCLQSVLDSAGIFRRRTC